MSEGFYKMKKLMFVSLFLVAVSCYADELTAMCQFNVKSANSQGIFINNRRVKASGAGIGSYSGVGPYSECFKSGTNILSISCVEQATPEMLEKRPYLAERTESAQVKIGFSRYVAGELAETQVLVDETFSVLPTNIVFSVPEVWPIKHLVWEGEPPPALTDADKAEIKDLLQTVSDAYTSYGKGNSLATIWELEKFKHEQYALLEGMSLEALKTARSGWVKRFNERYSSKKIVFKTINYRVSSHANLVQISVEGQTPVFETSPIIAYGSDGSGGMIGPEWFSKINGKWCIVP